MTKIITRFPPSPTGPFHVGSVRTALYNYLFARQNDGQFILRIEDTDRARSEKKFEDNIFDSLKWLGLENDGEVWKQSERGEVYKQKLQHLISSGNAYVSQETEGENKEVIRFKNKGGVIKFEDLIRGEVEMDITDLGDFVIAKSLDEPLYHLTVVVDDLESGVTHVIRGEDHISNTPRQIAILEALGGNRPLFAHLPLVLAGDRSKLSKRKHGDSVSLDFYRSLGYLPEAILNFVALLGWNPGTDQEIFSLDELVKTFDLKKVQKGGAIFNTEKLDWVNKEHLKTKDWSEVEKAIISRLDLPEDTAKRIAPTIFERINKYSDIDQMKQDGEFEYYVSAPTLNKASDLIWKKSDTSAETIASYLGDIINLLENLGKEISAETIKDSIYPYADKNGRGEILHAMRYALSGRDKSPDPFSLVYILGIAESLSRLRVACDLLLAK